MTNKRKAQNPPPMPSHDLDRMTIPAGDYLGKSEAPYIKAAEGEDLDGFKVEPAEPLGARAAANEDNLSLEPHLKAGGAPGEPADKQVLIRITESDRTRWGEAAKVEGVSVSEFVRNLVNEKVKSLLECPHTSRKFYKWPGRPSYSFCNLCGKRLAEGE